MNGRIESYGTSLWARLPCSTPLPYGFRGYSLCLGSDSPQDECESTRLILALTTCASQVTHGTLSSTPVMDLSVQRDTRRVACCRSLRRNGGHEQRRPDRCSRSHQHPRAVDSKTRNRAAGASLMPIEDNPRRDEAIANGPVVSANGSNGRTKLPSMVETR